MTALKRRVDALDTPCRFLTLGDLLDHLDGAPLDHGRPVNPALLAALKALP